MSLTRWKQTFSRDGCAFQDGEVSIYLAGTTKAARIFDENEKLLDAAPQINTDGAGYVEFSIDTDDYSSGQLFDVTCQSGNCIYQDPIELKSLMILQDTEGGRAFKQIFAQSTAPDIDDDNVKEGDLFFDTDNSNHPYRYNGENWIDMRDGTIATAASTANWSQVNDDDGGKPYDNADVTKVQADVLIQNPNFEDHEVGWDMQTGWSVQSVEVLLGSYAAQSDGAEGLKYGTNDIEFPASEGDRFLFSWRAKRDAVADGRAGAVIRFYDASDSLVDTYNPNAGLCQDVLTTSWTMYQGVGVAPASTAYAKVQLSRTGPPTQGMVWIDNVSCVRMLKDADIDATQTTNGPAEANADKTSNNTANDVSVGVGKAVVETGADKTGNNTANDVSVGAGKAVLETGANKTETRTANNTTYVNGSQTQSANQHSVYGDLKIFNGGDLLFYDSSVNQVLSIANTASYCFVHSQKSFYIDADTHSITLYTDNGYIVIGTDVDIVGEDIKLAPTGDITVNGDAGVSGTFSSITSVTIKNGIVTGVTTA